jgi:hypothetical protein
VGEVFDGISVIVWAVVAVLHVAVEAVLHAGAEAERHAVWGVAAVG